MRWPHLPRVSAFKNRLKGQSRVPYEREGLADLATGGAPEGLPAFFRQWQDGTSSSLRIGRDRFSVLPAAQEAVEDERLAPPLVQAAAG